MDKKVTEKPRAPEPKTGADAIRKDAAGQYGSGDTSPNPGGLHSANPVVLSGDGDATVGAGHGRDRNAKASKPG